MDKKLTINSENILEEVKKALKDINYGEIIITIHNSKVVQIEKRQKKRFNQTNYPTEDVS
ncbi:MAG: YezD family protein [Candidatus Omnitrophica bacterium]|nr:YezD family protein [Candidatus Omnitrophota bacterium]